MHSHSTHKSIVAAVFAIVALVAAATASAQATKPELRAMLLNSEGLNALYGHTGPTSAEVRALRLRSEALNAQYGLGSGPTAAELRALRIRSEGMNALYGHVAYLADSRSPDTVDAGSVAHTPVFTTGTSSFSWGAVGIGAGALLGAIALLSAAIATGRTRRNRAAVA